jgi:hypothetical protein
MYQHILPLVEVCLLLPCLRRLEVDRKILGTPTGRLPYNLLKCYHPRDLDSSSNSCHTGKYQRRLNAAKDFFSPFQSCIPRRRSLAWLEHISPRCCINRQNAQGFKQKESAFVTVERVQTKLRHTAKGNRMKIAQIGTHKQKKIQVDSFAEKMNCHIGIDTRLFKSQSGVSTSFFPATGFWRWSVSQLESPSGETVVRPSASIKPLRPRRSSSSLTSQNGQTHTQSTLLEARRDPKHCLYLLHSLLRYPSDILRVGRLPNSQLR